MKITDAQKVTLDALHRDHPDMQVANASESPAAQEMGIDPEAVFVRPPEGESYMYVVWADGYLRNVTAEEQEENRA